MGIEPTLSASQADDGSLVEPDPGLQNPKPDIRTLGSKGRFNGQQLPIRNPADEAFSVSGNGNLWAFLTVLGKNPWLTHLRPGIRGHIFAVQYRLNSSGGNTPRRRRHPQRLIVQFVLKSVTHHLLLPRGNEQCFPAWYVRAIAVQPVDCLSSGGSVPLWRTAVNAYRTCVDRGRCWPSTDSQSARIVLLRGADAREPDWGTKMFRHPVTAV
jgi:hypothetical protein